MSNLETWNKLKQPPTEALKTIRGGRLSGMTDIKPQWRYQIMTETFGMCGFGWKFDIVNKHIESGSDGQMVAFVDINLFVKVGEEWSSPISGSGGSMLVAKESAGLHTSDEAYKMATTDALSTAMKMIGVASDIYMGNWDGTKYKEPPKTVPDIEPLDVLKKKVQKAFKMLNYSESNENLMIEEYLGDNPVAEDYEILLKELRKQYKKMEK